jgi:predicted nucleic acid-binding protein
MAYLLDTGVLLRIFSRADPQYGDVRHAVRLLRGAGEELVTSQQNIAEFWNVCTRPVSSRGGFGMNPVEAARRLRGIERLVTLLDDTPLAYNEWKALTNTHAIIGVAVHDARIVALMRVWNVANILTLNPQDFQRYQGVIVATPADVIGRLGSAST